MRRSRAFPPTFVLGLLASLALLFGVSTSAEQIALDVALDTPVLLAGRTQTAYLRVALQGFELEEDRASQVNLAIVLDRSSSMQGAKLAQSKQAAIMAVERLSAEDIVSVVTYDTNVHVLVPATKAVDRDVISNAIRRIEAGQSTALFAGVSKGSAEVRKFFSTGRVNRIILLSDGLANVGPSSPGELASLGASLARDGISVTTIGLGLNYNEGLMRRLAERSDGNHFFAEAARDLERVYRFELGEVLSVVAQGVELEIELPDSIRPVRILGRTARIDGQKILARLNQLYSRQTKYFLIQVEIPAGRKGEELEVAQVGVSYSNLASRTKDHLTSRLGVSFSDSQAEVESARNLRVMGSVARQLGVERNRYAMRLRDEGKIEEARAALLDNAAYLQASANLYSNAWLERDAKRNFEDAESLSEDAWQRQRKAMEANQFEALQSLGYIE